MLLSGIAALAAAADGTTAGCVQRPDLVRFGDGLTALESSWAALDEATFLKDVDHLRFTFPCLTAPLTPDLAARTHRAFALDSWVRGDESRGLADLAAARAVDPSWKAPPGYLPDKLAIPPVDPAEVEPGPRIRPPHDGDVVFDGEHTRRRPDRVTVMQWVGGDGVVRGSWYLDPSDPLPDYDAAHHSRRNLLMTSGIALALGGAAYGAAFASGEALQEATSLARVQQVQLRTNALTAGGVSLGVAGLSALGLAVAVGR